MNGRSEDHSGIQRSQDRFDPIRKGLFDGMNPKTQISQGRFSVAAGVLGIVLSLLGTWGQLGGAPRTVLLVICVSVAVYGIGTWVNGVDRQRAAADIFLSKIRRVVAGLTGNAAFDVRHLRDAGEVHELDKLDATYYGDAAIPEGLLLKWWRKYPNGLCAAFDDLGNIAGGLGIWPLTRAAYEDLRNGHRSESQLSSASLAANQYADCKYWYVSGVMVKSDARNTSVLHELVFFALHSFVLGTENAPAVRLVAVATSKEGALLLRNFRFKPIDLGKIAVDNHTRYVLEDIHPGLMARYTRTSLSKIR